MANTDIDYCPESSTSKCMETQYLPSPGTLRTKTHHTIPTQLLTVSLMNIFQSRKEHDERADFSSEWMFPKQNILSIMRRDYRNKRAKDEEKDSF